MISEIDIADFDVLPVRELYKVKPRSYIKLPWLADDDTHKIIFFDHVDGMYSYCLTLTNEVVHLSASAQVTPLVKKANPD